jgi:hypothetical protein
MPRTSFAAHHTPLPLAVPSSAPPIIPPALAGVKGGIGLDQLGACDAEHRLPMEGCHLQALSDTKSQTIR